MDVESAGIIKEKEGVEKEEEEKKEREDGNLHSKAEDDSLRLARNTWEDEKPLINIPMLRFSPPDITQEVSELSLAKINRLGGFL